MSDPVQEARDTFREWLVDCGLDRKQLDSLYGADAAFATVLNVGQQEEREHRYAAAYVTTGEERALVEAIAQECDDNDLSTEEAITRALRLGRQAERDRVAAIISAAVMEACKRGTSQSFDEGVHAVQFALAAALREVGQ